MCPTLGPPAERVWNQRKECPGATGWGAKAPPPSVLRFPSGPPERSCGPPRRCYQGRNGKGTPGRTPSPGARRSCWPGEAPAAEARGPEPPDRSGEGAPSCGGAHKLSFSSGGPGASEAFGVYVHAAAGLLGTRRAACSVPGCRRPRGPWPPVCASRAQRGDKEPVAKVPPIVTHQAERARDQVRARYGDPNTRSHPQGASPAEAWPSSVPGVPTGVRPPTGAPPSLTNRPPDPRPPPGTRWPGPRPRPRPRSRPRPLWPRPPGSPVRPPWCPPGQAQPEPRTAAPASASGSDGPSSSRRPEPAAPPLTQPANGRALPSLAGPPSATPTDVAYRSGAPAPRARGPGSQWEAGTRGRRGGAGAAGLLLSAAAHARRSGGRGNGSRARAGRALEGCGQLVIREVACGGAGCRGAQGVPGGGQ